MVTANKQQVCLTTSVTGNVWCLMKIKTRRTKPLLRSPVPRLSCRRVSEKFAERRRCRKTKSLRDPTRVLKNDACIKRNHTKPNFAQTRLDCGISGALKASVTMATAQASKRSGLWIVNFLFNLKLDCKRKNINLDPCFGPSDELNRAF